MSEHCRQDVLRLQFGCGFRGTVNSPEGIWNVQMRDYWYNHKR
jgi:hypothetical protein